ncbi:hypothetical protein SISNIDRAFT_471347 [Sistotremastrum niveocremeum HHB9708]|uniref:Uncharacterized protein n=1 Tax=Sistotremastrum niveocremeum HHB9708 TaxID=1314777 RepID=A0A164MRK9_9AGAM|nr:hypothetical protein SISNIDRAFT_471347 [Sistotremastrum niveocremeum HHB9708]
MAIITHLTPKIPWVYPFPGPLRVLGCDHELVRTGFEPELNPFELNHGSGSGSGISAEPNQEDASTPPSNNLVPTHNRPSTPHPLSHESDIEAGVEPAAEPGRAGAKKRKLSSKKGQTVGEPASKKKKVLPQPVPRWKGKENMEPPRADEGEGEGEGEGDSVGQRKKRVRQRNARGEAAIQALTGRRRKALNGQMFVVVVDLVVGRSRVDCKGHASASAETQGGQGQGYLSTSLIISHVYNDVTLARESLNL